MAHGATIARQPVILPNGGGELGIRLRPHEHSLMQETLAQLQIDHRNMRQLLRVLEEELQAYQTRGSADFDLMGQILEYTLHYPTLVHHPREEALFRRLLERDPSSKAMVGDLTKEHEELSRLTHRFAAALHNVAHDVEVPRVLFTNLADDYVARSKHHMETEEQKFFPRLMAVFTDDDWADFDGLAARGYDPLFGTSIEKYYKTLHQRILNAVV
jgi:hemerythrin-like domain-containing protein